MRLTVMQSMSLLLAVTFLSFRISQGDQQAATKLQVDMYYNFHHASGSTPAAMLMEKVVWNLCPVHESETSPCYWNDEEAQERGTFSNISGHQRTVLNNVQNGTWQIYISGDHFHKVRGSVRAILSNESLARDDAIPLVNWFEEEYNGTDAYHRCNLYNRGIQYVGKCVDDAQISQLAITSALIIETKDEKHQECQELCYCGCDCETSCESSDSSSNLENTCACIECGMNEYYMRDFLSNPAPPTYANNPQVPASTYNNEEYIQQLQQQMQDGMQAIDNVTDTRMKEIDENSVSGAIIWEEKRRLKWEASFDSKKAKKNVLLANTPCAGPEDLRPRMHEFQLGETYSPPPVVDSPTQNNAHRLNVGFLGTVGAAMLLALILNF